MNTNNYNETLKDEYRTSVLAFFNTVEEQREDCELSARMIFEMARYWTLTKNSEWFVTSKNTSKRTRHEFFI